MKTVQPFLISLFIPAMLFLGACGCCQKSVAVAPTPPNAQVVVPFLGDVFYDFNKTDLRTDTVADVKSDTNRMQAN
jgi:peptidoglycan-associated lipoprotein